MPQVSGTERQRLEAASRPSAETRQAIERDPKPRFANQVALEEHLSWLRLNTHLAATRPTITGAGNIAHFPNAIVVDGRIVLGVTTSIEPGTVLAADSVTVVEWETHDGGSRYGHMSGSFPIVVGNPAGAVPDAKVTVHAGKRGPDDITAFPYAAPQRLPNLPPAELRTKVNYYGSAKAREDRLNHIYAADDALLHPLAKHLEKECSRRNADWRTTDRDDLASLIAAEVHRIVTRFASPDRPLNGGQITTVIQREVPKYVERRTIDATGMTQRDAAMWRKSLALGIDFSSDSPETVWQTLHESAGDATTVVTPTRSERDRYDRVATAHQLRTSRSLDAPTSNAEGATSTVADTHGEIEAGYEQVDEHAQPLHDTYRKIAMQLTYGCGIIQTDDVIDQLSVWIATFFVSNEDPTAEQLDDPSTGWPVAAWIFQPLLASGDAWTKPGVRERLGARLQPLGWTEHNAYRAPEDVARIWSHYLNSDNHQVRSPHVPAGVVPTD